MLGSGVVEGKIQRIALTYQWGNLTRGRLHEKNNLEVDII